MAWYIVAFENKDDACGREETAIVPTSWICETDDSKCYWPPLPGSTANKLAEKSIEPNRTYWPMHSCRILGGKKKIESLTIARQALNKSVVDSDFSDKENLGRGFRKKTLSVKLAQCREQLEGCLHHSSEDESDSEETCFEAPFEAPQKTLTMPKIHLNNALKNISNVDSSVKQPSTSRHKTFPPVTGVEDNSPFSYTQFHEVVKNQKSSTQRAHEDNSQGWNANGLEVHNNTQYFPSEDPTHLSKESEKTSSRELSSTVFPADSIERKLNKLLNLAGKLTLSLNEVKEDLKQLKEAKTNQSGLNFDCSNSDILTAPLDTIEAFKAFNAILADEDTFKKFVFQLYLLGGKEFLPAVYKIMRTVLTNDVARLFTTHGRTKENFKDTNIAKAIKVAVRNIFPDPKPTDASICAAFYNWLSMAKKRKADNLHDSFTRAPHNTSGIDDLNYEDGP